MAFLNNEGTEYLIKKLSDSNNIKISGNKYGDRVSTVMGKLVEKADNITRSVEQEITNECYTFRVGTGNVDVSSDVEDGFGEIGLKGRTYQNVIEKYEFLLSSNASYSDGFIRVTYKDNAYSNAFIAKGLLFEPSTKYTVIFNILENTLDSNFYLLTNHDEYGSTIYESKHEYIGPGNKGVYKYVITTRNNIESRDTCVRSCVENTATTGYIKYSVIILEGDYTNDDNAPIEYFEGIVGVGDKSKNLLNLNNDNLINATIDGTGDGSFKTITTRVSTINGIKVDNKTDVFIKRYRDDIKIAIRYYLNGELVNKSSNGNGCFITDKNIRLDGGEWEDYDEIKFIFAKANDSDISINEASKLKIQVQKGDSNIEGYEPYNKNIIEVTSLGKNIYKPWLQTKSFGGLTFDLKSGSLIVNGTCIIETVDYRPVLWDNYQCLKMRNIINKLPVGTVLTLSNNLGITNYWGLVRGGKQTYITDTITIQENDSLITNFVRFRNGETYDNQELKIQMEINSNATEIEPYIEDKIQIVLDEPLMRLPNGVYDEITSDGKLIRRVGKVVLNGSESWRLEGAVETNKFMSCVIEDAKKNASLLCNRLKQIPISYNSTEVNIGVMFTMDSPPLIRIRPFENMTLENGKQWLRDNPTTLYYELETPIITDILPPSLRIFKNGNISFNTIVAPESTHTVQLNKSAQIESCIRQVGSLDKRVDNIETLYDELLLETSRNIDLLCLDYNLETGWE